jgi:hypothetical protein
MWHGDLLLGNNHEISNYAMTVTRQWPVNSNRGMVFSVQSAQRCYKQDKLVNQLSGESVSEPVGELDRGLLQFSCELLLREAGS